MKIFAVKMLVFMLLWTAGLATSMECAEFYAGRWDSSQYNFTDKPATILLRVKVEDYDTRLPLSGVRISLGGEYHEYRQYGQPQKREFELIAVTGRDGVAVFGLLWHERSRTDDIEKVQRITTRAESYRFSERSLSFGRLIRRHSDYERDGWKSLLRETAGAKYFLPTIGARFDDYNNEMCRRPELFQLVRDEDYGRILEDWENTFMTHNPQRTAGPFLMLPVTFRLERIFQEHRITAPDDRRRGWLGDPTPSRNRIDRKAGRAEDGEQKDVRVWERYGDGYVSDHQCFNVEQYINKAMTKEEIIAVLGPPANDYYAPRGNNVLAWISWENSRNGIMVIITPEGEVTRIERR